MKVHDLKPAAGLEDGRSAASAAASAARAARPPAAAPRARARAAPSRPGFEGGQTPLHRRTPEGEGVQEPVPGRVPRREPRHARGVRRRRRGHPGHAARRTASWPSGAWSRCSAGASSPRRSRSAAHGFSAGRDPGDRGGGRDASRCFPLPWGDRPPAGPRERPHQPVSTLRVSRVRHRRSSAPCHAVPPAEHVPGARPAEQDPLHDLHHRDLPARRRTSPFRTSTSRAIKELKDSAEQRRRRRLPRPLLRRRDHQRRDLLPRDHAVHHGVDHHAAARRRDPEARAVAERGPDRAEEDHAVDPLPHRRRSRSMQSTGFVFALHQGKRRPARLRRLPGPAT